MSIAACTKRPSSPITTSSNAIRIVCTTGMVADIVQNIAGEHATVHALMGAGVDPHLYKPTRADIQQIMDADIVFTNGLLLEGKMAETFQNASNAGKAVVALGETLPHAELRSPAEFEGHPDPHVWMSPRLWSAVVEAARNSLKQHDPAHADEYDANTAVYLASIDELHTYAAQAVLTIPESQRVLVTAHDAFGYFGREYNIDVVGIQGISTESEAGVRDIERLVSLLVEKKVPAVFVESTVSDRNIRALIDGAKAQGQTVSIGGTLFSDAMGTSGTYEGTYIGMIDHNVTTIVHALGGNVPEHGLHGTLSENAR
ncbi:MAG: zinc ABC transporter substrate-binding protein [Phycisphaerales bacterium]